MAYTTKEKIKVMLAYDDGVPIEFRVRVEHMTPRGTTQWDALPAGDRPLWNWQLYDYRIKPKEPRKVYAVFTNEKLGNRFLCAYGDDENVSEYYKSYPHKFEIVEMTETLL